MFRSARTLALGLLAALGPGCAAMTNPVADGVPARRVPAELLACSKTSEQTIPLQLLRQPPPREYRLAPGDVLAVYVEGFLGKTNLAIPVNVGALVSPRDTRQEQASTGYPVPVQEDGTIDLPVAGVLRVEGLSLPEVRQAVRDLYVRKDLLKTNTTPIIVSLLQQRHYSVLVLRQEGSGFAASTGTGVTGLITTSKRGTGFQLELGAYENDILHALARSGGLPGLDAWNEVIVYRDCFRDGTDRELLLNQLGNCASDRDPIKAMGLSKQAIRIPLRVPVGQTPSVRPEDILLRTGDVVFLEARDDQLYYSGGLLPPGAHVLPRDHDLDVLEAVALVRGPLVNGAFGGSNLSGAFINPGLGNPSPALVSVLRRTPGGGQVAINVDLNVAMRDPAERILVRAGDMVILQERPEQALTRYLTQTFFNFDLFWQVIHTPFANGVIDVSAPDRLTGSRVGTINAGAGTGVLGQ